MTPRQPSVQNVMLVTAESISEGIPREKRLAASEQSILATSFQPLHNFADVLGAAARAKQQRVRSLNHNQIADADCGDKFLRAPEEITLRVECRKAPGGDVLAWLTHHQLVHSGPRADIAPAYFGVH